MLWLKKWGAALTIVSFVFAVAGIDAVFPCHMYHPTMPVELHHISSKVEINEQVATETVSVTFHNPNQLYWVGHAPMYKMHPQNGWYYEDAQKKPVFVPPQYLQEATYYMELEPDAQVDNLTMKAIVDGKEQIISGELLDAKKAQDEYLKIVNTKKDPALLEYFGGTMIRARVFPIPPKGDVTIQVRFTRPLKNEAGLVALKTLKINSDVKVLKSASFECVLKSRKPIKNVYSPTHPISIVEGNEVKVAWKQENYLPKHPLTMYFAMGDDDMGLNVLAHKEAAEKGYFMMMVSPTLGGRLMPGKEIKPMSKDVVFCVDTSGSMLANGKLEQAKAGLKHCLQNLKDSDRFNIVDFSTEARVFTRRAFEDNPGNLVPVNETMRKKATDYLENMRATGSTAIEEALTESLKVFTDDDAKRMRMIIFMTDGMPNVGESNADALANIVKKLNSKNVRLYVFGEGYDVNTRLLEALAADNKGFADYILPEEKVEERVGKFYDKISYPVMSDLALKVKGVQIDNMYPKQLPDVFKGGQLVLFGRYDGSGESFVELSGTVNGEAVNYTYNFNFPKSSEAAFLPRLWAGRKVAFLLNEIKRSGTAGQDDERVKEIIELSKRHGIVTPYTSYLITEDHIRAGNQPGSGSGYWQGKAGRMEGEMKKDEMADAMSHREGGRDKEKVVEAQKQMAQYSGHAAPGADASKPMEYAAKRLMDADGKYRSDPTKAEEAVLNLMRYVGSKTFYRSAADGFWYDSTYQADKDKDIVTIKFGSDEYLKLLRENPALAKYLALGNVVVKSDGKTYKIELPKEVK